MTIYIPTTVAWLVFGLAVGIAFAPLVSFLGEALLIIVPAAARAVVEEVEWTGRRVVRVVGERCRFWWATWRGEA